MRGPASLRRSLAEFGAEAVKLAVKHLASLHLSQV